MKRGRKKQERCKFGHRYGRERSDGRGQVCRVCHAEEARRYRQKVIDRPEILTGATGALKYPRRPKLTKKQLELGARNAMSDCAEFMKSCYSEELIIVINEFAKLQKLAKNGAAH